MSLKKEIKKAGDKVVKALSDPLNAVNMMYSGYALERDNEKHRQRVNSENKAAEAANWQAAVDAADREFQDELDRKRRTSKRQNVIFAGLLGNNEEIGLGGQKNLLGL